MRPRIALTGLALPMVFFLACHVGSTKQPSPEDAARTAERDGGGVLDAKDLENLRVTRVEELIEARVSGVRVRRLANGEYSIQIRGINAIHGNTEPLFVVDGVPLPDSRSLIGVNPVDVARIQVVKDGTAAAYGVRGANGVILITTRPKLLP